MAGDVPTIAAASSFTFVLEEIAAAFRAHTNREVRLVFGSSGALYRRIEQGATFQIFMSADERFVRKLAHLRRTMGRGRRFGIGRLVLFAPHQSRVQIDPYLRGLRAALARDGLRRLTIADPAHAAYGSAAAQALRRTGLWHALQPSLLVVANAAQAAQLATGTSTDAGVLAYALVRSVQISRLGRYVLLPETLHAPLHQRVALLRGAGDTAHAFYRYLQEGAARAILRRYGLVSGARRWLERPA